MSLIKVAFSDNSNIVQNVLVFDEANLQAWLDSNEYDNYTIVDENTDIPNIGWFFDKKLDKWIAPKPHDNWVLDEEFNWIPPIPKPTEPGTWHWHQNENAWVDIPVIHEEQN
jgi:hypothetical protein